jgi:RND family efflux transporter MFP subunit
MIYCFKLPVRLVLLAGGAAVLAGCGATEVQQTAAAPTVVTVSQPVQEKVADFVEFSGNIAPLNSVDLRARVKGFLKKTNFVEGAYVKEGDLLYEIDPDQYQAEVDSAKAKLDGANASLDKAKADLAIKQEMAAGNAASKLDVIQAQAAVEVSTANVALCNAQLQDANINLGYTKIYAPLTGRIDKSRVDPGNLVGADGNTLLATIVQANQVYVYFGVDEATMQRFQERLRARGIDTSGSKPKSPFTLALGDTADFRYQGQIDFIDNKVDPSTGTIKVRGILNNPDSALVPGFFARVRIPDGEPYEAMLLPDRAIGVDQGQKYVLVVDDKNVVELRPIETGSQQGRMRVVKESKDGLKSNEWVITEGLLRTRPGATVSPDKKSISDVETGGAGGPTSNPAATTQPQA